MKKILITGCNGYVARNLSKYLSEYDLVLTNRNSLNLLDPIQVKNFFSENFFDVVIHTAISGGSRLKEDNYQDFFDNCIMHQNILENSCSFDKYISFGSGAELDRRYDIDTSCDLSYAYPIDPYGMSKNFIAKSGLLYPNFNNIRIFGVFNHDELSTRMIKANILNYIHKQPIVIHKDRWMDFFFMDDLCKVVKFVIDSDCKQKTINCCYKEKYKLSKIASYINQLSNYEVDIIIENDNLGLSYFGDYNLHLFDVELSGMQNGIVKTYKKLLETK
jgi:nucleoside-diphosphate-sugar epimerase